MVLLAAGVISLILPLGWIAWENPGRFPETIQRELRGEPAEYLPILFMFLFPSLANAWVGFRLAPCHGWGLVPLCLIVPVWVFGWVIWTNDAKGPIGILLSLVPAGVCWLAGRMGQVFRLKVPPAEDLP